MASDISALWGDIFGSGDEEHRNKLDILREIPLFKGLNKRGLRRVLDIMHDRNYEKGEMVFEQGQPGAAFFMITKGALDIVAEGDDGGEYVLATLKEGSSVGELALLDATPRSAAARAAEKTETMAFFREDLNKLLESEPYIGSRIYQELSSVIGKRLRMTNEQLAEARDRLKELEKDSAD